MYVKTGASSYYSHRFEDDEMFKMMHSSKPGELEIVASSIMFSKKRLWRMKAGPSSKCFSHGFEDVLRRQSSFKGPICNAARQRCGVHF